jgi:hypothetical protein
MRLYKRLLTNTSKNAPSSSDSYWSNVALLMDGETLTDKKNHTLSINAISLSTSIKKFGTSSLYFNGSAYASITSGIDDFVFGTSDFTIEMWVNYTSLPTHMVIWGQRPSNSSDSSSNNHPLINIDYWNKCVRLWVSNFPLLLSTTALNANTWYHIAVSRQAGVTRMFINGALEASVSDNRNLLSSIPSIGYSPVGNYANFRGYMDEVRVTKSIGRYTSNFTPISVNS